MTGPFGMNRISLAGTVGMLVFAIAAAILLAYEQFVFAGTAMVLFSFSLYVRETYR